MYAVLDSNVSRKEHLYVRSSTGMSSAGLFSLRASCLWHSTTSKSKGMRVLVVSPAYDVPHLPMAHYTSSEAGDACSAVLDSGGLLMACLTCPGRAEGPAEAGDVCNAVLVGRQVLVPLLEVLLHDAIQPAAQRSVSVQAQLQQGASAGLVTTYLKLLCASAGSCKGPAQ